MNVETFVFDTPDVRGHVPGLKMYANRYTNPHNEAPQDGLTIIACHGLSQRTKYTNIYHSTVLLADSISQFCHFIRRKNRVELISVDRDFDVYNASLLYRPALILSSANDFEC